MRESLALHGPADLRPAGARLKLARRAVHSRHSVRCGGRRRVTAAWPVPPALHLTVMHRRTIALSVAAILLLASVGAAQFRGRGGRQGFNGRQLSYASLEDFDGGYQFCRLVFRNSSNGDGAGWNVDYPRADEN